MTVYLGKGPMPNLGYDPYSLLRHRRLRFCRLRSQVDGYQAWSVDETILGPRYSGLVITCDRCGGARRL